ncbi:hypothetical protein CTAYLR_007746 [Chrysophaeum taylorii]|uniref:Calponin-homology (CH) domain-containing protein n=1 Tax=Chrysophaeum taylorii TaxID=2483200 RepID=A0AAD7XK37_9STRA|nr:hypothetical protein CTAYLR_007746 [Chrysophaeum taylorii]
MKRQRRLFTNFTNAKLADRDDVPPVTDIFEDIRDGRLLYALLEELSGQSLAPLGKVKAKGKGGKPLTRIDHVANLSISFRYIKQTTKIVGIGPGDIADGNPNLILGLLWSIIVFFTAKDLGGIDDVSALKKKILKWCQKRTEKNDDVRIRNLGDSFMHGRAFHAILNDVDPVAFPYAPGPSATDNFKLAFGEASSRYGVPELLDGDDEDCWKDEQSMVTYLSEMMKRLPEHAEDLSPALMNWIDDHTPETTDDLDDLCSIPSVPTRDARACARCAEAIAAIMTRDGLANVEVVAPPGDGAPFVLASSQKFDKTLPTVLFVADYGVDDPSPFVWTGSPFAPEKINQGTRLRAAGASSKAGVLAPLKAIAALVRAVEERPPVNVEILLACAAPGDLQHSGRVEKFVASRYATDGDGRPPPHYALVDTPGAAASVAPGKFATVFACRGEVEVDVTVATVAPDDDDDDDRTKNDQAAAAQAVVGPLLDANLALCQVAASLRKPDTALLNVPGLVGFPEPNRFTKAVTNLTHLEAKQLAANADYPAPPQRLATLPASKWSVVEQLCFHPSISVLRLALADDSRPDPLSPFPGISSTMTIFAHLAPAFDHDDAINALRMCLEGAAPWCSKIQVAQRVPGHTGFLTDISPQFLSRLTSAAAKRFPARGAALAAAPSYLPLAAAVSRALPRVATYACGVADLDANLGAADESVSLEDLTSTIKTFAHLVFNLKGLSSTQTYGKVDASEVYVAVETAAS